MTSPRMVRESARSAALRRPTPASAASPAVPARRNCRLVNVRVLWEFIVGLNRNGSGCYIKERCYRRQPRTRRSSFIALEIAMQNNRTMLCCGVGLLLAALVLAGPIVGQP